MSLEQHILVSDTSSIGAVRRAVARLAESIRLPDSDAGRAGIIASELATNLMRHARPVGGWVLFNTDATGHGLEILAMDSGPGIRNLAQSFEDGYSTAGTAGNGLGAVKRLADELDLFTAETGTVIWARVVSGGLSKPVAARPTLRIGGWGIPVKGETVSGDAWRLARSPAGGVAILVADGLGHGPLAAEAASAICKVFDESPFKDPASMIDSMHTAAAGTRGAAVSIGLIDPSAGKVTFAGIGNVAGTVLSADGTTRGLVSHNGTVGLQSRKAQALDYPWTKADTLVLCSDGLQTRWSVGKYPGLIRRHPAVLSGVLMRDFRRGRDDATVVAVSHAG